ncbi:hypothetical protein NDU88_001067 [Pleurodeles waltl]|uniref:Uncharacterized protein n=1 Tax=Pleurodeles waltl TaxID=8319 RepID=A0AAV7TGT4_PLEWA|nr:hypothetical protein NDU88_001067 [Pleurodeles waltl]
MEVNTARKRHSLAVLTSAHLVFSIRAQEQLHTVCIESTSDSALFIRCCTWVLGTSPLLVHPGSACCRVGDLGVEAAVRNRRRGHVATSSALIRGHAAISSRSQLLPGTRVTDSAGQTDRFSSKWDVYKVHFLISVRGNKSVLKPVKASATVPLTESGGKACLVGKPSRPVAEEESCLATKRLVDNIGIKKMYRRVRDGIGLFKHLAQSRAGVLRSLLEGWGRPLSRLSIASRGTPSHGPGDTGDGGLV